MSLCVEPPPQPTLSIFLGSSGRIWVRGLEVPSLAATMELYDFGQLLDTGALIQASQFKVLFVFMNVCQRSE